MVYKELMGCFVLGLDECVDIIGVYVYVVELLFGKDILLGYWEIVGVLVLFEWGYFSDK